MPDLFDDMVDAYRSAFTEMRGTVGKTTDAELATYENLDKAGFDKLRKQYGLEQLTTYIRRMEARRQGVK
jgi:hypothetical protein